MEFTKLKIDKNIPVPVGTGHFDFSLFEVGDSSFLAGDNSRISRNSGYQSALRYGNLNGKKFAGRSVVEDGVKGVRIWRVK